MVLGTNFIPVPDPSKQPQWHLEQALFIVIYSVRMKSVDKSRLMYITPSKGHLFFHCRHIYTL